MNIILMTASGHECLVDAENIDSAIAEWEIDVASGEAEPLAEEGHRRASRSDAAHARAAGHDYRY